MHGVGELQAPTGKYQRLFDTYAIERLQGSPLRALGQLIESVQQRQHSALLGEGSGRAPSDEVFTCQAIGQPVQETLAMRLPRSEREQHRNGFFTMSPREQTKGEEHEESSLAGAGLTGDHRAPTRQGSEGLHHLVTVPREAEPFRWRHAWKGRSDHRGMVHHGRGGSRPTDHDRLRVAQASDIGLVLPLPPDDGRQPGRHLVHMLD